MFRDSFIIFNAIFFLKKSQLNNYFNYAAIDPESENKTYRRNSAILIQKNFPDAQLF